MGGHIQLRPHCRSGLPRRLLSGIQILYKSLLRYIFLLLVPRCTEMACNNIFFMVQVLVGFDFSLMLEVYKNGLANHDVRASHCVLTGTNFTPIDFARALAISMSNPMNLPFLFVISKGM